MTRRQSTGALPREGEVYKLRIVLRDVSPLIWRHLLVRSEETLAGLHEILQIAFGWTGFHLYSFRIYQQEFGPTHADPHDAKLADFKLHRREKLHYVYDFGDWWEIEIRLLDVVPIAPRKRYPVCVGGKRAGPPEDCGGPEAYLQMIDDHDHRFPLDALGVVAGACERLLEAEADQPVREAIGDMEELQDAMSQLDAFDTFQPDRFVRRELNAALRELEKGRP